MLSHIFRCYTEYDITINEKKEVVVIISYYSGIMNNYDNE